MLSLIVAHSENNVIGKNGKLPWHISEDMKHFRKLTLHHTIIMGRKTYESIGKPLPDRQNIIVTRQKDFKGDGCMVVHSMKEAMKVADKKKEIFVIGGGEIYALALPLADRVYATIVYTEVEGDAYFPTLDLEHWQLSSFERLHNDETDLDFSFTVFDKRKKPTKLYYFNTGRNLEQIAQMEDLEARGVCVFCTENFVAEHREPIEIETKHWLVTKNDYPYEHTKLHLLIVPKSHANMLSELSDAEMKDYGKLLKQVEKHYKLTSYGQFMRVGDFRYNGASIHHLHAHIVVADSDSPEFDNVRVKLGSSPKHARPKFK